MTSPTPAIILLDELSFIVRSYQAEYTENMEIERSHHEVEYTALFFLKQMKPIFELWNDP